MANNKLLDACQASNYYKKTLKNLIDRYIIDSNEKAFTKAIKQAGDNYFKAIFPSDETDSIDVNRKEKIKNLIKKFTILFLYISLLSSKA